MEWISVKDKMPEPDEWVLVNIISRIYIASLRYNRWEILCYQDGSHIFWGNVKSITHWMPLPELPKRSNNAQQN